MRRPAISASFAVTNPPIDVPTASTRAGRWPIARTVAVIVAS